MTADVTATLLGLVGIFQELAVPYAVGGSLASSVHGEPRTTHDADVLVDLHVAQLPDFLARLTDEFYVSEEAARRAIETASSFNLVHFETGHKLDLFVAGASPLDRLQLEWCRNASLGPGAGPVRVTSPAVLILRKLLRYRSGGAASERQWRDVVGVLRVQGSDLDLEGVRQLAADLDLTELLARAVRDSRDG